MGALGARPRDLAVPEEKEVQRRLIRTTAVVFVAFLVAGWLGMTAAAVYFGYGIAVGLAGTVLLTAYGTVLGVLLFRGSQREVALIRTLSIFLGEAPIGIVFLDTAGNVTYANRAVERMTGRSLATAAGTSAGALVHPDDRLRLLREMERRAGGESSVYELRLLTAEGKAVKTIVLGLPFMDGGRYDGSLAAIIDVTELFAMREAALRYKELSSFALDAVTHDLSNRMQEVTARAGIASAFVASDPERTAKALASLTLSADRAARLIKEVKQIAMAERQEWPKEEIALQALIDRAIEMADLEAPRQVEAKVGLEAGAVHVEASELAPLLISKLIEHAAEGSAREGARPLVLEAGFETASPGEIVLRIHGFAREVSDEDLKLMLAPPRQAGILDTPWRSGVKLAFAAAIAQAHGWGLRATRAEGGKGAVFEVRVPLGVKAVATAKSEAGPAR